MEKELQEQYEYAHQRLGQKKRLYYHFIILIVGGVFIYLLNEFYIANAPHQWPILLIVFWLFVFVLHFFKVFVTDKFMNKAWEREQINKLILEQQKKREELKKSIQ